MRLRRLMHRSFLYVFFFNDTATTEIYTLSLHDALPISSPNTSFRSKSLDYWKTIDDDYHWHVEILPVIGDRKSTRLNSSHSSISYAVFCLKKKKRQWP